MAAGGVSSGGSLGPGSVGSGSVGPGSVGQAASVADRIVEDGRIAAAALGRQLASIHQLALETPVAEFAPVELACLLGLTRFAAEDQVRLAFELCDRLPSVLSALCNADIDVPRARVFADVLSTLDTDLARTIAAAVLPYAPAKTTGQLRAMLRRRALSADPAFTTARRERSAALRCVQLHADDDGTASLTAFGLDATRATASFNRISAIARQRKIAGSSIPLAQLRADVLLELLEGQHASAAYGVTHVTVSLESLARLRNDPASLAGFGPIAADIARQWAHAHPGYQWQYSVTSDGTLLQQGLVTRAAVAAALASNSSRSADGNETRRRPTNDLASASLDKATPRAASSRTARRRTARKTPAIRRVARRAFRALRSIPPEDLSSLARPPDQDPRDRFANAALARWIRLRDKTCRMPGCRMPAIRCDIDHTIRHADGGLTRHDNLCTLCRHHHRAKEEGGWTVIQVKPGHFRWISPLGRVYEAGPEPPER